MVGKHSAADVTVATSEDDVRACWAAFARLRPHLSSADELVERWHSQSGEGYRIASVAGGAGAIGYRLLTTLAWGRMVYVDDLVVAEAAEGGGLAVALLDFVKAEARRLGCAAVHLDSGYQRKRAHALYLRNGFVLDCHHFAWAVD
jgi:GNAT superfamily N-acetyltransferase